MSHLGEGQLVLGGHYRVLRMIQAGAGNSIQRIGLKGRCRFCGRTEEASFRKVAHTFPEALGNRWVVSLDECDDCNRSFGLYEDALASALRPFLTLGGTAGKTGVPQTGRSGGRHVIQHGRIDQRRQLRVIQRNVVPEEQVERSADGRRLRFHIPVEGVRFRPRLAYKALSKIGLSLLPLELLPRYSKLLAWLQTPADELVFPVLEVGLSFGSIGNAPPVVSAVLLQRVDPAAAIPHIYVLFCAGSVCAQFALMSDELENHLLPTTMGAVQVNWSVALGPQREIQIDYGTVWPFNWTDTQTRPGPVKGFVLDVDSSTSEAIFTPVLWDPEDCDAASS